MLVEVDDRVFCATLDPAPPESITTRGIPPKALGLSGGARSGTQKTCPTAGDPMRPWYRRLSPSADKQGRAIPCRTTPLRKRSHGPSAAANGSARMMAANGRSPQVGPSIEASTSELVSSPTAFKNRDEPALVALPLAKRVDASSAADFCVAKKTEITLAGGE